MQIAVKHVRYLSLNVNPLQTNPQLCSQLLLNETAYGNNNLEEKLAIQCDCRLSEFKTIF